MDWQTILTGIGAVLTAAGGCALVIREFRRRDRRALTFEVEALSRDVAELRADLVACRRHGFELAEMLADRGIETPAAPEYHQRHP